MKVLVISDTHGKIDKVKDVLEEEGEIPIQAVLHCGDYVSDARILAKFYPHLKVYSVYGNCDVGFGGEYNHLVELEDVKIYMTHGHRYGVKWGEYEDLVIDAAAYDAQVAVCGHSHQAYLKDHEGMLVMNPGSITLPRDTPYPSYGILEVEKGKILDVAILQLGPNGQRILHPVIKNNKG